MKENFHNSQKNGNMSIHALCFRADSQYYVCQFIDSCMGSFGFSVCLYSSETFTCWQFESYSVHTYKVIINDIDLFIDEYLEINSWKF